MVVTLYCAFTPEQEPAELVPIAFEAQQLNAFRTGYAHKAKGLIPLSFHGLSGIYDFSTRQGRLGSDNPTPKVTGTILKFAHISKPGVDLAFPLDERRWSARNGKP